MGVEIDRAGNFRGVIMDYDLREEESGAIAVVLSAAIEEIWNAESASWDDWKQYGVEAKGRIYIVKKDGTINESQSKALMEHCGWDGDFSKIINHEWTPTLCSFVVNEETYKEQSYFRIAWFNAYDRVPGGLGGNLSPEKAKELQTRFGSQFRALRGNIAQNQTPTPESKPSMPKSKPAPKPQATVPPGKDDEIPF